jgi:ubiquinone/menaquinone biosynthesis C-methylase UbiE
MANNVHFDLIAPLYERVIRPPDPARIAALLDLPASGWLLDAAGGTGRVAAQLCPLVERLVVSDLSLPMLQQVAPKGSADCRIVCSQGRVEHLPFADGQFARILVVDAFHHFSHQLTSLRELARVLQPGGRLLVEEPDIRRFSVKMIALAETLALMGSRFRPPDDMRVMFEAAGLQAHSEDDGAGTAWILGIK